MRVKKKKMMMTTKEKEKEEKMRKRSMKSMSNGLKTGRRREKYLRFHP